MIITQTARQTINARQVDLTGNTITNTDGSIGYQVGAHGYDIYWYATAAELSEFGHRLIELAAIAEEREHGPVDLDRSVA